MNLENLRDLSLEAHIRNGKVVRNLPARRP